MEKKNKTTMEEESETTTEQTNDKMTLKQVATSLTSQIFYQWQSNILNTSEEPIRYHQSQQKFHGKYFSEGAQDIVSCCSLPHEISSHNGNGYSTCNQCKWTDDIAYVSSGYEIVTLGGIEHKLYTNYLDQMEK